MAAPQADGGLHGRHRACPVTNGFLDVALGKANDDGSVRFVKAMAKPLG